jgi:hypothetical protein
MKMKENNWKLVSNSFTILKYPDWRREFIPKKAERSYMESLSLPD